jgi:hypothetical protein
VLVQRWTQFQWQWIEGSFGVGRLLIVFLGFAFSRMPVLS